MRRVKNGTAERFWTMRTGSWASWYGTGCRRRRSGASCSGATRSSWTSRCAPPCLRQRPETAGCGAWRSARSSASSLREELTGLKDYLTGQAADGVGEGLEQQAIRVDGGELYVHMWQPEGWSIQTEAEQFGLTQAQGMTMGGMSRG